MGADRIAARTGPLAIEPPPPVPTTSRWTLQATLPGAVIRDLSFATPQVGYAVAELGQVWKTTDGGNTWVKILNVGFPYYWDGVQALTENDVVISGNNNQTDEGMIRWSHDGGATWTPDILLTSSGWSYRVRFADADHGLVFDSGQPGTLDAAHYTTNGGKTANDWTRVEPTAAPGWFERQFSLLPSLHAAASGIHYCASPDGGATWECRPSIDSVFDGPVFFVDDNNGWVGGGLISPYEEGWIHRTTDGGKTWSDRTLAGAFPIRQILFIDPFVGWAAGGDINFATIGGIYFSSDGGQTWSLDLDSSGREMSSCDSKQLPTGYQVWCAGYSSGFQGAVYTVQGAATPTFSPAPGAYVSPQPVTLTTATPNATIYYSTDGSMPTTQSTTYTGPLSLTSNATIRAIAGGPGYVQSGVGSAVYTIAQPPQVQLSTTTPAVSVTAGTSANLALTVGATGTLSSAIALSCSGLPAGAQCVFSPSSAGPANLPANVSLKITTPAMIARHESRITWTLAFVLPAIMVIPAASRKRRRLLAALGLGLVLLLALTSVGCGGGNTGDGGKIPHSTLYTVTINAVSAGATSGSLQVQLTIIS